MTTKDKQESGYDTDEAKERYERRTTERKRGEAGTCRDHPHLPRTVQPGMPSTTWVNLEEDLDVVDELPVGFLPVPFALAEWESILEKLGHMQCVETKQLLKAKTVEALWTAHGDV